MNLPVRACIGLGANLGQPEQAIAQAFQALDGLPQTRLLAASGLYRTAAWGRTGQPDFINAAAVLETRLAATTLLEGLLRIEAEAGRQRDADSRWGPRVLDLDLLLYGEQVIDLPTLKVPHPYLHQRAFALLPLAEIAADAPFPGRGRVADALVGLDRAGVQRLTAP
jgi:2-amino-4-hydroxy-6-hydroxymethyldihydropteridine diphosphokinase